MWWNPLIDLCIQECDPTCLGRGFPRLTPTLPIFLQPTPFTLGDRNILRDPTACVCVLKHRHLTFVDLPLTVVMPCARVFNVKHVALTGHLLSLFFVCCIISIQYLSNLQKI